MGVFKFMRPSQNIWTLSTKIRNQNRNNPNWHYSVVTYICTSKKTRYASSQNWIWLPFQNTPLVMMPFLNFQAPNLCFLFFSLTPLLLLGERWSKSNVKVQISNLQKWLNFCKMASQRQQIHAHLLKMIVRISIGNGLRKI